MMPTTVPNNPSNGASVISVLMTHMRASDFSMRWVAWSCMAASMEVWAWVMPSRRLARKGSAVDFAEIPRGREIPGADRDARLLLPGRLQRRLEAEPPDGAVEDDAEGEEKSGEDGPHDPAALR